MGLCVFCLEFFTVFLWGIFVDENYSYYVLLQYTILSTNSIKPYSPLPVTVLISDL